MGPYVEARVGDLRVPPHQIEPARPALHMALTTPGAWTGRLDESIEALPALRGMTPEPTSFARS